MMRLLQQLPPAERRITLPTWITISRIVLTPLVVWYMINAQWVYACALFVIACLTDALDGALARWRNERTVLGALLDPIADKFLLLACLATLTWVRSPAFIPPAWLAELMLIKEIIMIGGAATVWWRTDTIEIKPTPMGKLTTALYCTFIIWHFVCYFCGFKPIKTYSVTSTALVVITAITLLQYIIIGFRRVITPKVTV